MPPVALFVYNRLAHVRRVVQSLLAADGAEQVQLFIFSDGAKNDSDRKSVADVRAYCHAISGFDSVSVVERDVNVGLAQNIIGGVGDILRVQQSVIVLEDDLIVSKGFLVYMRSALDFYHNKNVFSIAGYTPTISLPSDYPDSTYAVMRNCSWGWATWQDRWNLVDWQVADFNHFIRNRAQQKEFNSCGNDLTPMLLRQQTGEINSWSIRFCYAAFRHHMPTIYPCRSLISNGGADGSGTNVSRTNKYATQVTDYIDDHRFTKNTMPIESIVHSFSQTYNTSLLRRLINKFKIFRYCLKN